MPFLLIIAAGMAVAKYSGVISISWIIIAAVAVIGILPYVTDAISGIFNVGASSGPTATKDSCGCQPGQKVRVAKKGWFGYKKAETLNCADALIALTKNKRVSLGCVNV